MLYFLELKLPILSEISLLSVFKMCFSKISSFWESKHSSLIQWHWEVLQKKGWDTRPQSNSHGCKNNYNEKGSKNGESLCDSVLHLLKSQEQAFRKKKTIQQTSVLSKTH